MSPMFPHRRSVRDTGAHRIQDYYYPAHHLHIFLGSSVWYANTILAVRIARAFGPQVTKENYTCDHW